MLHILCAFLTEAKPIINYFELKPWSETGSFPVFLNEKQDISLTLSGMGKASVISAVTHTHQSLNCSKADAWINIGIAGHGKAEKGEVFLAHCIIDANTQQKWHPQNIFSVSCKTSDCLSLDSPNKDYKDCLFDMEASGFYSTCIKLTRLELVHCLKIVSDTPEQSFEDFQKEDALELIQNNLSIIDQICNELKMLSFEFHETMKNQKPS